MVRFISSGASVVVTIKGWLVSISITGWDVVVGVVVVVLTTTVVGLVSNRIGPVVVGPSPRLCRLIKDKKNMVLYKT